MSRKRYTEEFRTEAVKLVASVGVTKASAELGVTPKTLRTWSEPKDSPQSQNSSRISRT